MRTPQEIRTEFAPRESLDGAQSFFLVGIGGAGMSGVARMLKNRGFRVRGTDSTPSHVTELLEDLGIEVTIGHTGEGLDESDVLVLTDAIDLNTSPEVQRARELGLPLYRRSQVLGWLLKDKKTVAVTGTHGKTTTTGMVAAAFRAAGLHPTIVAGAEIAEFGGAIAEGDGDFAVVEACEAYDSLRDFDPYLVVLTNLEPDHLDFHGNWENLRQSMLDFLSRIPEDGALVYNPEDEGACDVAKACSKTVVPFGELSGLGIEPKKMSQKGKHNEQNAAAALTALSQVGDVTDASRDAVARFRGAERRQQIYYDGPTGDLDLGDITIIDDYAHHPTEIVASLDAIRQHWIDSGKRKRLVVVFQPHLYSRTANHLAEFSTSLDHADYVVLTDIYPARETPIPGISSLRLVEGCQKPTRYIPSRHLLPRKVAKWVQPGDVIVGMGAGNISEFAGEFVKELGRPGRHGKPKIMVAYGGDAPEREVSIHSSLAVHAALVRRGFDAFRFDVSEALLGKGDLSALQGTNRPDLVVLAIHGTHAEDGAIQGMLELAHLNYTGGNVFASALSMDKNATKRVLEAAGLPVPRGEVVREGDLLPNLKAPLVVKPNSQGSTVGLTFVKEDSQLEKAIADALRYDESCLVEEWVVGIEISVPVFDGVAFPPVEVVPASGSYDFASKYVVGATEEICPARITAEQTQIAMEYAFRSHEATGGRDVTRTDMIVMDDRIVILEINTLPGMTPTSLVPLSAKTAGIDFDELVERIVNHALARS
ncbi:MAG: D-alanine--D-alanine ligase [Armatimonadetes bacterium]|nr:D-alanine--D-alanine ligase [Armatimonadota bacterium]